ncbi:MAG TPA: hypothetical protein VFZ64_03395 [Nocardioidaceae bacterium]
MTAAQRSPQEAQPVERFRPTSGRVVGGLSLALMAAILVSVAVEDRSVDGLRIAAGIAFLAVVVWVTQLRPRATAFADRLDLQNSLRDVSVPMRLIDEVSVRRVLTVRVGSRRYVCIGVGAPLRRLVKARPHGPSSLLGWDRLEAYTEESTPPRPDQSATEYADFVETRIASLAAEARSRRTTGDEQPRTTWAWPEMAALVVTALVFTATLLL